MSIHRSNIVLALGAFWLLVAGCGGGDPVGGGPEEWGPLAVVAQSMGDQQVVAGTLEVSDDCVILDERGHRRYVVAWPAASSSWQEASQGIGFDSSGGSLTLHDTNRVSVAGAEVAELSSIEWVSPPGSVCEADAAFVVFDVTDVVLETDFPAGPDGPIGGGLGSGTGVDLELECPPDVEASTEEWYGPVGLTLDGAVAEAFGDLVVGWIGEPFNIETTEAWSSWGLEDDAGNLVAVATVVASGGGWDPSHARYCVLAQPTPPPPPFTLYVSNQSFDDPTVRITISIDDQFVVDEDFDVEGQHNWISFAPDVEPGDHTLEAISDTGVQFRVDFSIPVDEPRWAVVDYWHYPDEGPPSFTFNISDEPIGFG